MANYPEAVYSPRTKENKAGVVYTPAKTTVGYVEDVTKLDDEVVAIETALGANLKNILPARVTTKTETALLTTAEAGVIKISAAAAEYTITLPTAVGNTGLTYHFIKTDANYTTITLDADGTETFNYTNATRAPALTYTRLNTYCAEVTIISDGANWQCINERIGEQAFAWAWTNATQSACLVPLASFNMEGITTNIGSNYSAADWVSSSATSTSAGHLVDSTAPFTATMVNKRVHNTTDDTWTWITAFNSATDVTVRDDIFVNTETYEIKHSIYTAPVAGYYMISYNVLVYGGAAVDGRTMGVVTINSATGVMEVNGYAPTADAYLPMGTTFRQYLNKGDTVELQLYSANSTTNVYGNATESTGNRNTYLRIWLDAKE